VVVTEKDAADERPLEVALNTQQWAAVRLLVGAGALTKCPEMDDERRELERLMPSGRPTGFFGKSAGIVELLVRPSASLQSHCAVLLAIIDKPYYEKLLETSNLFYWLVGDVQCVHSKEERGDRGGGW
jgi:hypothetical protein